MAIDYKQLFASNHFSRAQYDILRRLVELAIAEGGGGGGVSDPLKADKSTVLIAGTGLQGGGDLSNSRTFALDLAYLDARYPVLNNGQVSVAVIPPAAIHDTFVVADQAAMLASSAADIGDYAVRQDTGETFVLKQQPYSTLANWVLLPAASGVSSFKGRSGAIVPAQDDYTFAQLASKPTTLAGYAITDAEPTISAGTTAQFWRGDKTWQTLNKAAVGLGNVDNTADNSKPLGTAQLATLAAGTGSSLLGHQPTGTGGIARALNVQLDESALSLRAYNAAGNGTSDDTTPISNWLTALKNNSRRGYVPAGTYLTDSQSLSVDNLHIECHPLAKFIGKAINTLGPELAASATSGSWSIVLSGGAAGTVTQDGSGIHFIGANNIAAVTFAPTPTSTEDNVQIEITYTVANMTGGGVRVIVSGATTNHGFTGTTHTTAGTYTERGVLNSTSTSTNLIRIQATGGNGTNSFDITAISVKKVVGGSATPIFTFTSLTGTSTAPVGTLVWSGGQVDTSARAYTNEGDAVGIKLVNYGLIGVDSANFTGDVDHETAAVNAVAGSGLRTEACNNVTVTRCHFRGHQDAGLCVAGGTLTALTDDGQGATITGNHFSKCNFGWKATRQARNVSAANNEYRQCYVGATALDANSVSAGRVSVKGEMFLKCGRAAIDLKQQNGAVVAHNTIIDSGYKLDGTTNAAGTRAAITLGGCISALVTGNVIRMDALAAQTDSYGIHNSTYSSVNPAKNLVSNNTMQGLGSGVYDDGLGTANVYRGNEFSDITVTNYDTVPDAFKPYGAYTPTVAAVTNVTTVTASASTWRRIEKDVVVNVWLDIDPTATGDGEVTVSLPVDPGANFGSSQDLLGISSSGTAGAAGHFIASVGGKLARMFFSAGTDVASHSWSGSFTYRLAGDAVALPPPASGNYVTDEAGNRLTDESGNLLTL